MHLSSLCLQASVMGRCIFLYSNTVSCALKPESWMPSSNFTLIPKDTRETRGWEGRSTACNTGITSMKWKVHCFYAVFFSRSCRKGLAGTPSLTSSLTTRKCPPSQKTTLLRWICGRRSFLSRWIEIWVHFLQPGDGLSRKSCLRNSPHYPSGNRTQWSPIDHERKTSELWFSDKVQPMF